MTRDDKYTEYKEIFYKYFIYHNNSSEAASNIPLSIIDFDRLHGEVGDGTINLALYIQYMYTEYLLGNIFWKELEEVLITLNRLSENCYNFFKLRCPNVYFRKEPGFFLRDDIRSSDAEKFNLKSINSGFSTGLERINEDPCFSPFVSQDQIWNLLPILKHMHLNKWVGLPYDGSVWARNVLQYVINNKHVIYNPYYSALYHNWTYLHIFEPYWERTQERNRKLKYNIKVKRGANNWYFAYGFRKAFKAFGGECDTFWSSLWYKPFVFLADRVYHPYICKWFKLPVKDTSYYSLAIAGDAWYGGDYRERIVEKFNKSLETGDLEHAELAFLTGKRDKINLNLLGRWLDNYPQPNTAGVMSSPLLFMTLYNWCKILHAEN